MKSIAVFTSGGDSPGMNAAIRAVVRTAICKGLTVFGVFRGYEGMIDGEIKELKNEDVSGIIYHGGTFLKTARSKRFLTKEGREMAYHNLKRFGIEGIIGIGGDGTFHGLVDMLKETDFRILGLPGTIDNDLYGTDLTIGYDTACNTAMEAIDKIKDTASSHERIFIIEVMGRHAGYIAYETGIASGAEAILIPETATDFNKLAHTIKNRIINGKKSSIIVVAEGDDGGGAEKTAKELKNKTKTDIRITILGHIQRGGSPTMRDRVLATRLGYYAVLALLDGKNGVMVGLVNDKIKYTLLEDTYNKKKKLNIKELEIIEHVL